MATDKQIAASRANGARSRGPKTPEGKARSARNSLDHGLLARSIVLESESRERFDDLMRSLNDTFRPSNPFEHLLIGKMAAAHWRQIRVWTLQNEGDASLGEHEMRLDRQFFRAVDRFVRLRSFFAETNSPEIKTKETNPANPTSQTATRQSNPPFEPAETQSEPRHGHSEPRHEPNEPNPAQSLNSPDCTIEIVPK
jgi:hypothetical protein